MPLLVALNLALAALLAWLWFTPAGQLRDLRWQPPQPVAPALADAKSLPSTDVDLARFVATLDRPLFVPTRRPPPKPQEVAAAPPPDPLPKIRLLGLYRNEEAGGMIASVDGNVRRVRVGDTVAGNWSLKALRGNEVVVSRGDVERTVALLRNAGSGVETAAETAAVVPGADTSGATSPTATARSAARERDLERRREQVRRMNAARARRGMPLLPEP